MVVYVDSSAITAVLLNEAPSDRVQDVLRMAVQVCTSTLTTVECSRALIHARHIGRISASDASSLTRTLHAVERNWNRLSINQTILERACDALPSDPVRTLDAVHIATALILQEAVGDVAILSLDRRMRDCASLLGFQILPESV
jgi:uncharacterized protein